MGRNLASWDRWLRAIAGVALIVVTLYWFSPARWVTLVAGVVLLATAAAGYCPIYGACRISTYAREAPERKP